MVRFHKIFGPLGTYDGCREEVTAGRKVAQAEDGAAIEVWGNGQQTRSYVMSATASRHLPPAPVSITTPVNLGHDRMVTVNELVDLVDAKIIKKRQPHQPQGASRNADLTLMR